MILKGIGASPGFGIGRAIIIEDRKLDYAAVKYTGAASEKARLAKAVKDFTSETRQLAEVLCRSAGTKQAAILEGHITMLGDPFLRRQMEEKIDAGAVAEAAADAVLTMFYDTFSALEDEIMRQRASDVKDIKDSLLRILRGVKRADIAAAPKGSILIAKDFMPSMVSQIKKENVAAIVTQVGGVSCHSAILARTIGIPAALSVPNATGMIDDGALLIADGFKGEVITAPTADQIREYSEKQRAYLQEKESLNIYFNKPTVTKSGLAKKVYGNIGKAEDAQNVLRNGGEGIGLFRTEFLFMNRDRAPTEQEQFEAYAALAKAMDEKEVIIRTLDSGGDKVIPYLQIEKEKNPFLGHRGIRFCLDNKALFKTQIRAVLRAAVCGDIKIMLPLVTCPEEVQQAKALIEECACELENEGLNFQRADIGVMIETPAAALISDLLAKEAAFFSIGTNDLTAYTMAVDRGNAKLSRLYDTFQPAVLRAIEMTIKNAKAAGIEVGMCGEAAANTDLIPKLIKWGLDTFSVTPSSILQTRKSICDCK
ncbi:MAG: phosphoenolpyruvate--protein phosphotransferase [Clostridia bacterium]|nr:phosphoenolpyruvate--protein phosphotransferase [Clostridia bacterium]